MDNLDDFKFGDSILMSDDGINWYNGIFIAKCPDAIRPYITATKEQFTKQENGNDYTMHAYKQIKRRTITVHINEIAKWKNCNAKDISIIFE